MNSNSSVTYDLFGLEQIVDVGHLYTFDVLVEIERTLRVGQCLRQTLLNISIVLTQTGITFPQIFI